MFSVMTRLPPRFRISPSAALHLVEQARDKLSIVSLDAQETFDALRNFVAHGLSDRMIYDAIILGLDIYFESSEIYTWNKKHFDQVAPDLAAHILLP